MAPDMKPWGREKKGTKLHEINHLGLLKETEEPEREREKKRKSPLWSGTQRQFAQARPKKWTEYFLLQFPFFNILGKE